MSEKRKDTKGRVLRTGESQRKDLIYQYLMGSSDVGVALNIYTHATYDRAAEQMAKLIDLRGTAEPDKLKKSG